MPAKSGGLRCYIQHKGSRFDIQDSVAAAKSFEENYGVFLPSVWNSMAKSIDHVRTASQKYFSRKSENGIVGYGTSIGATTILYALDIGHFFEALIDDDPYRQGLESPGFAIPIVHKDLVFSAPFKSKCCAVLAPRYVTQIIENNQPALDAGVIFVRVWPILEEVPNHQWQVVRPKT